MKGVGNKRLAIIFLASELRPTDERTGAVGSQRQQTEQETEGKKRVLYHQHRKMGTEVARACTRPRTYTEDRNNVGLAYVVPNADPKAEEADKEIRGDKGNGVLVGQAMTPPARYLTKSAQPPPLAPGARQQGRPDDSSD